MVGQAAVLLLLSGPQAAVAFGRLALLGGQRRFQRVQAAFHRLQQPVSRVMLLLSRTTGPPTVTPNPAMAASTVTAVHSISIPPFYTYSAVYGTASCRASAQNRMASPLLTGPMLSRCKAAAAAGAATLR